MCKWKRKILQSLRGCTFRNVSTLKYGEHIIVLHHNWDWHYVKNEDKSLRAKPQPWNATVISVDKERKIVRASWLYGYKDYCADISFKHCIAAYNENAKVLHFKGVYGNSDVLIDE